VILAAYVFVNKAAMKIAKVYLLYVISGKVCFEERSCMLGSSLVAGLTLAAAGQQHGCQVVMVLSCCCWRI